MTNETKKTYHFLMYCYFYIFGFLSVTELTRITIKNDSLAEQPLLIKVIGSNIKN